MKPSPPPLVVLVWTLLLAALGTGQALAEVQADPPPGLAPWRAWVLHGSPEAACPPDGGAQGARLCLFPTSLSLDLAGDGAAMVLKVRLFADGAVALPVAEGVRVERLAEAGRAVPVAGRDGWPVVWLTAGSHVLEGRLAWDVAPATLRLPAEIGVLRLSRDGAAIPPDIAPGGELRLEREAAPAAVENREDVRVFRLVTDGVPVTVTTLYRLEVSGLARTITLAQAVPEGGVPLAVRSPAPASLGPDGSLRLDAGPGRYEVEVVARYPGRVEAVGPAVCPYGREFWSFSAAPVGREARPEGLAAIDPQTADVPEAWRAFPAFLVEAGGSMRLRELGRGAPVGRDALTLNRELWLDFSGQGLTARDTLTGQNRQSWTLSLLAPGELGRVSLAGRDQPLVLLGPDRLAGVQLRQSQLRLVAESRYPDAAAAMAATGFNRECDRVGATLHLPPGWRLFTASGPDEVRGGLLSGWSLLDLFLVFVFAVAALTLAGKAAGLVLGALLLLSWHEPGAPGLQWLYVLAGLALLRVTDEGGRLAGRVAIRRVAVGLFALALVWLALSAVPFVMGQLRQAVAPQVGGPARVAPLPGPAPVSVPQPAMRMAPQGEMDALVEPMAPPSTRVLDKRKGASNYAASSGSGQESARRLDFDPAALVQTGPGLPSWRFAAASLEWKGPVAPGQMLRLYLVPPWLSAGLDVARVALLFAAAWLLFGRARRGGSAVREAVVAVLAVWLAFSPGAALAQGFPPENLLEEFKTRLLEPPRCAPHCLGAPDLDLRLENGRLRLGVTLDSAARLALPLPVVSEGWRPETVLLDGSAAPELARVDEGLRLPVEPGRHVVILEGPAPRGVSFTIAPAVAPAHVRVTAPGYRVRGVDDRGVPRGVIECQRAEVPAGGDGPRPEATVKLPAFFTVERALDFGLTFEVTTTVTRRSPLGDAVVVAVPLLPGELPDVAEVSVRDGRAMASFEPGREQVRWRSRLPVTPSLNLTAPADEPLVETWTVAAAPFYDVSFAGIAPAARLDGRGDWRPRFLPWPGESLRLDVSRPPAAPGAVLTLDRVVLATRQGGERRDVSLTMAFRAAKGGRHVVGLPAGAEVTGLTVAGRETLPTGGPGEVGFSLAPGATEVVVRFRETAALSLVTATPAVDLRLPAVNVENRLELPSGRWLLLARGDTPLGPVVLFWGWLAAVTAVTMAVACLPYGPLSRRQWLLYGLGLAQASPENFLLAVAWLLGLGWRRGHGIREGRFLFNLVQVLLVLLTLFGLFALYATLSSGLLGLPRSQVVGGGSTATALVWTFDRVRDVVPVASAISAPLLVFRALMLAWAAWLAWRLPRWLRFGFESLMEGGGWREVRVRLSLPGLGRRSQGPPRDGDGA